MKIDQVKRALGLDSDAALGRELGASRGCVYNWRASNHIPAHRRFQIAKLIQDRGGHVPDGLLDPAAVRRAA